MTAQSVAFICALVYNNSPLMPVLAEHLSDNEGEVLPHLLMSDIIRWVVDHRKQNPEVAASVFQFLNSGLAVGDDETKMVIGASGVEMIPSPGTPGAELRELMSPDLRAVDLWQAAPSD